MSKINPSVIGLNKPQSAIVGKYQMGQVALMVGLTNAQLRSCLVKIGDKVEFINDRFYFDSEWVDRMNVLFKHNAIQHEDWYPRRRYTLEEKERIKEQKAKARKAGWILPIPEAKSILAKMCFDQGLLLAGPKRMMREGKFIDKYKALIQFEQSKRGMTLDQFIESNEVTPSSLREMERGFEALYWDISKMSNQAASTQMLLEFASNNWMLDDTTPLSNFVMKIDRAILPWIESSIFQNADHYIAMHGHQRTAKELEPIQREYAQREWDDFIAPMTDWSHNVETQLYVNFDTEESNMIRQAITMGCPRMAPHIKWNPRHD